MKVRQGCNQSRMAATYASRSSKRFWTTSRTTQPCPPPDSHAPGRSEIPPFGSEAPPTPREPNHFRPTKVAADRHATLDGSGPPVPGSVPPDPPGVRGGRKLVRQLQMQAGQGAGRRLFEQYGNIDVAFRHRVAAGVTAEGIGADQPLTTLTQRHVSSGVSQRS